MKAHISVITLGVNDLEKALAFYRDGLGLPTEGIVATELKDTKTGAEGAIALFKLQGGLMFALYPRTELAKDAGLPLAPHTVTPAVSLGYAANSKKEVDALLQKAKDAGAAVIGEPHERPWGIYSGYFQDLDGYLWEILWNPSFH